MPEQWSNKRERQYDKIRKSAREQGESPERAKEIAARMVNKERARSGESRQASRSSTHDVSSGHRGGKRSGHGSGGPTKEQLYNEARQCGIKGRSRMTKRQLQSALGAKKS